MKFSTKEDPLVTQQRAVAERDNIEAIRTGVKGDTDQKNRIYGGNLIRRLAMNRGMNGNG